MRKEKISGGNTSVFCIGGQLETATNGCENRSQPCKACKCKNKSRRWKRTRKKEQGYRKKVAVKGGGSLLRAKTRSIDRLSIDDPMRIVAFDEERKLFSGEEMLYSEQSTHSTGLERSFICSHGWPAAVTFQRASRCFHRETIVSCLRVRRAYWKIFTKEEEGRKKREERDERLGDGR